MESSTAVTNEAITSTKTGIRNSGRTKLRISDTVTLDPIKTSVVAMPNPRAFTTVPDTANKGHKPSNCTKPGLLYHKPSAKIFWYWLSMGCLPCFVGSELKHRLRHRLRIH